MIYTTNAVTEQQLCIIHQIRNSTKYISYKDMTHSQTAAAIVCMQKNYVVNFPCASCASGFVNCTNSRPASPAMDTAS